MAGLQEWIHRMEEGRGARIIQFIVLFLVFVMIGLIYDLRCFKNFSAPEAMDTAQLARRFSQGKGYTTDFVRPFSMYLIQKHRPDHDPLIKLAHPDLANPPVYPLLLAGLMKIIPFNFEIPDAHLKVFRIYSPEIIIAVFNQVLFFIAALFLFWMVQRIWDAPVAYVSAAIFVGTELFWRFSISGLSTILLVLIFVGICWGLVRLEQKGREQFSSLRNPFLLALLVGALVGIGGMTRYSFGWLIIPVIIFMGSFVARHRVKLSLVALVSFFLVMTPWLARNYKICGVPFGTAGYAVFQLTPSFAQKNLERFLNPQPGFRRLGASDVFRKFMSDARTIVQVELPKLGGNWVIAFFLVGLLIPLPAKTLSRLRIFLFLSLVVLIAVQALGLTPLSVETPEINSENLLVIIAPLLFVFGVGAFFILLTRAIEAIPVLHFTFIGLFIALASAPLIFSFLPPKTYPLAYPPYYPPIIQGSAGWMKEKELMMSDIPWAVAWYGQRQCAWLTLDAQGEDFFRLNDDLKTVQGLYLTPRTTDSRFLTEMIKDKDGWPRFVLEILAKGEVPSRFPLRKSPTGFLPDQVFLTDWERWRYKQ